MCIVNSGAIVERAVRRSGMSITELAKRIRVNRRSVYYWFSQETLSYKIVSKISVVLGYDFSAEIPDFKINSSDKTLPRKKETPVPDNVSYWMTKYLNLLDKYNRHFIR